MSMRLDKSKTLKQLETECDKLWSQAVHKKYGGVCAYSGQEGTDSHHVFLRRHTATRWDLDNGILLSRERHTEDSSFSAHKTPTRFLAWAMQKMGERKFSELEKKSRETFQPTMRELESIIRGLRLKV